MGYSDIIFDKNTRFLVTGGAGFIGSNLCEAITKMGYNVRCLDDFSVGKRENIIEFQNNPLFELTEGDIRNYDVCLKACENIDYVLHQAAWGSVPRSVEMPLLYNGINITGTLNMMEAARQNNVKKFVYASSAAVYGDTETLPQTEGKEGKLLSPYALTKKVNEDYGQLYTKLYGLDTYGLRYFNVYGKRQDPNGAYAAVIPIFIKKLINGEQPLINGDGLQTRDFVYIDDIIQANLKACKASCEAAGQAYNVAYGTGISIIDMYNKFCKALNKDIKPVFADERKGDIKHSYADITKAAQLLDYNPDWSFERGIDETVDWYARSI